MRALTSLRVVCGKGTLNASRSPSEVKNEDLVSMDALTVEHDTWQKEGGAAKFNTTQIAGAPKVSFLWDFMSGASVQELVVGTSDGKYLTVTTSGIDKTLASGLGTGKFITGAEGSNTAGTKGLFLMNGFDQMKIYTGGATAVDIANPAADWVATLKPRWAFLHNNRMYAGGRSHRVYASLLEKHDDYLNTGALTFNVYPGEGEYLVGGTSWRGRAYFFKYPQGIYYLDDSSADTTQWQMKRLSFFVGAAGEGCYQQAADEVVFISPDNYIHALSAVNEFGDAMSSAILPTALGTYLRENVNLARLDRVTHCFYASKRKIMFGLSAVGSDVNNLIIGLDAHRIGDTVAFKTSRDECEALCIYRDPNTKVAKPLAGNATGYIYKLDQEARNKDGTGYTSGFLMRNMELFQGGQHNANLKELELEFVQGGNWFLNIDVYQNGSFVETLFFSLQGLGAVLGSFVLDADVLGTVVVQNRRARLHGDCRRVQYQGYNNTADESYSIAGITTKLTQGNDR